MLHTTPAEPTAIARRPDTAGPLAVATPTTRKLADASISVNTRRAYLSALTRRSDRSYLRPDIAASHRARPSFTAANPPQFRAAFRQPPRPCPPNQPASTHPHLFQESPKEALGRC